MKVRAAILTLVLAAGCGGEATDPTVPTTPPRELPQPLLRMVAPTAVRVGDDVTIFGMGFADKGVGETRLTFEGIFQTSSGKTNQVKLDVTPRFENQGLLTWSFGPNIPFTTEEDTGTFRGILRARNVGLDGSEKQAPQAIAVEIQVLPSILIRQMRPISAGCPVGITATTDETPFMFEVKAIGLKSGSQNAPLRFVYTFLKENFQFKGYFANQAGIDPESLFPKSGPVSVVDDVYNGTISTLGTGVPKNVYVFKGGVTGTVANLTTGTDSLFGLSNLTTAPVPTVQGNYAADSYTATMSIVAMDSAGQETKRVVKVEVYTPVEVRTDGSKRVAVRSYDPVAVTGCIPGGDIGRQVTYSEMTSETRTRSFTTSASLSAGFDIKVLKLNAEFGFEVNSTVSSAKSKDLQITGTILPKQFGAFYRQTIQMEVRARLVGHGPCGSTQDLGEVIVTDWVWSPDLAKNMKCPPLPVSNLPPGEVFKSEP
jgi:hypothetical protein